MTGELHRSMKEGKEKKHMDGNDAPENGRV
jgi:hypothetical protein